MTDNANPSLDPADVNTMAGMLRSTFRKLLQSFDGMLPAEVITVSEDRNWVVVRPCVKVMATDGTLVSRAQVAKVPVFTLGGGGWVISWPIAAGDLGWIIAADRDISLFLQEDGEAGPNTNRVKSFSDGLFLPDMARRWTLQGDDTSRAVWQNADGSVKIAIGADKIRIVHGTRIDLDTPLVHLSGNLAVEGNITTPHDVTAQGTVTGVTDVVFTTISAKVHHHVLTQPGAGNSGGPA